MLLKNREDNRNYLVTTERDGDDAFTIFAVPTDGGNDKFMIRYETLSDFLEDWEDAD